MVGLLGIVVGVTIHFGAPQPPESYLMRAVMALESCQGDIPAIVEAANEAAKRLARGGRFLAGGQSSWVSELCGRAGGIMMLRPLRDQSLEENDVIIYACEPGIDPPASLTDTKALVIGFGASPTSVGRFSFSNPAADAGISPTLANAIPGWLFVGETVAALTRLGKMPVMFETIGAYGGYARIAKYKNGEIAFHDDVNVPPIPGGVIANRYIDTVSAMLRRIEKEERTALEKTGAWAREAKAGGKRLYMYSMGHLFPAEVEKTDIGKLFRSAAWNAGFRSETPKDEYGPGDLAILIGYQHPAEDLLRRARPAGARGAYVSVRLDRDFTQDDEVAWIDPMWNWSDACVFLEGYDVPILPASGVVNGAIAWEIYRVATQ